MRRLLPIAILAVLPLFLGAARTKPQPLTLYVATFFWEIEPNKYTMASFVDAQPDETRFRLELATFMQEKFKGQGQPKAVHVSAVDHELVAKVAQSKRPTF